MAAFWAEPCPAPSSLGARLPWVVLIFSPPAIGSDGLLASRNDTSSSHSTEPCDDNSLWAPVQADPSARNTGAVQSSIPMSLDPAHSASHAGKKQPFTYLYGCSGTNLVTTSSWTELNWLAAR